MKDDRQKGSEADWLQHSNDELARMVRCRDRRIAGLRLLTLILLLALGWVVFKFAQKAPITELWRF